MLIRGARRGLGRFAFLLLLGIPGPEYRIEAQPRADLNQLVGKQVIVQKMSLCHFETHKVTQLYSGRPGTVVAAKPSPTAKNPDSAVLIVEVDGGEDRIITLETCSPVTIRDWDVYLRLDPDAHPRSKPPQTGAPQPLTSTPPSDGLQEPEYLDTFFRLDGGARLIPLERQLIAVQGSTSTDLLSARINAAFYFPGSKSPVRFRPTDKLEFVVRTSVPTDVDPNTAYCLRRLDLKKNSREFLIAAGYVSPVSSSVKSDPARGLLPITFARYGKYSLRIATPQLQPGEYALSNYSARAVSCFGVDY